jgi:hypothetical protein
VPDAKKSADPAPDGFLRICWASSFKPYVKRVKDEVVKSKATKRKANRATLVTS